MSSKEERPVDWILLGRDCWREVFSWVSFEERNKIRQVCLKWNEWIVEHKIFWPISYKNYYQTLTNILNGKYKKGVKEFDHDFVDFIISSIGILLIGKELWIYDPKSWEKLYCYEKTFEKVYQSENNFVGIQNNLIWLFSFEKSFDGSVKLVQETKLIEGRIVYCLYFSYPYIFGRFDHSHGDRFFINAITKVDMLGEDSFPDISINGFFVCKNYLFILKITEGVIDHMCVYNLSDLKNPPVYIKVPHHYFMIYHHDKVYLRHNVKVYNTDPIYPIVFDDKSLKDLLDLSTSTDKKIEGFVCKKEGEFISLEIVDPIKIFPNYCFLTLDCFHPTLPFIVCRGEVTSGDGQQTLKFSVYSKKYKTKIADIPELKEKQGYHAKDSKIYYNEKNDTKHIYYIDFSDS